MKTTYEFHDLCLIFPQADERTLADMAKDIAANGLNDPIVLYEDKILDGRNRYLACRQAGVEPTYKAYHGEDPLNFVVLKNLHRRHLTDQQRAFVATEIYQRSKKAFASGQETATPKTVNEVAEAMQVSPSMVRDAIKLDTALSPATIADVASGVIPMSTAKSIVKRAEATLNINSHTATPEQKETLQKEVDKVLQSGGAKNTPPPPLPTQDPKANAEEFNEAVLGGVYSSKQFTKTINTLQKVLQALISFPGLANTAYEAASTLVQETLLRKALRTIKRQVEEAQKRVDTLGMDMTEAVDIIQKLLQTSFGDLPTELPTDVSTLEAVRQEYSAACTAAIIQTNALLKKYDKDKKKADEELADVEPVED